MSKDIEIKSERDEWANDIALARAGESENHAQDIGGALPAAPCSACGDNPSEHDERFLNAIKWMEMVQEAHSK